MRCIALRGGLPRLAQPVRHTRHTTLPLSSAEAEVFDSRVVTLLRRYMPSYLRCIVQTLALTAIFATSLPAQALSLDQRVVARVVALNGLVGGLTSAVRAGVGGNDVRKPFLVGVLGGSVYGAGKTLGSRGHLASAIAGSVVSGLGSSVVANGGRGAGWADELMVPAGPLRARFFRRERDRFRLHVNATEALFAVEAFAHPDLRVDWKRSAAAGAFVFVTDERQLQHRGDVVGGMANTSVIVLNAFAGDADRVLRHEIAHVHQYWFQQENWGKPIEDAARRVDVIGRWVPSWIEIGFVVPVLRAAELKAFGYPGPLRRMKESEAATLERR